VTAIPPRVVSGASESRERPTQGELRGEAGQFSPPESTLSVNVPPQMASANMRNLTDTMVLKAKQASPARRAPQPP